MIIVNQNKGKPYKHSEFILRGAFDVYGDSDWVVIRPLKYRSKILNADIHIPEGFVTDFASIPRVVRLAIPVSGRHRYPAVIHDWFYRTLMLLTCERVQTLIDIGTFSDSREIADAVFNEANRVIGVSYWKRRMLHRGVRVGGWVTYNKNIKLMRKGKLKHSLVDTKNLPSLNRRK